MGNFSGQFFTLQWSQLQAQFLDHLDKADFVPVDVSQFSPSQVEDILNFIGPSARAVF